MNVVEIARAGKFERDHGSVVGDEYRLIRRHSTIDGDQNVAGARGTEIAQGERQPSITGGRDRDVKLAHIDQRGLLVDLKRSRPAGVGVTDPVTEPSEGGRHQGSQRKSGGSLVYAGSGGEPFDDNDDVLQVLLPILFGSLIGSCLMVCVLSDFRCRRAKAAALCVVAMLCAVDFKASTTRVSANRTASSASTASIPEGLKPAEIDGPADFVRAGNSSIPSQPTIIDAAST